MFVITNMTAIIISFLTPEYFGLLTPHLHTEC